MPSKFVDNRAIVQVIGSVFLQPSLLETYNVNEEDFVEKFHQIVFGTLYHLYEDGVKEFSVNNVVDFLSPKEKSYSVFKAHKGDEWLNKIQEEAQPSSFDYYFHRLKKFSLLRAYDNCGVNVRDIYDPDNIFDLKTKQKQEEWLDNSNLVDIAQKIDNKIDEIKIKYVDNYDREPQSAAEGIRELVESFKIRPEVGVPLYGSMINTITRGARLRKFYLRSAPSGLGKTRTMIADACYIGCDEIYNEQFGMWIKTGVAQPTLYITTEQDLTEIQTMMLAFLSNVNEEHILNGRYDGDELQRVERAIETLERAPIYVVEMPDFSLTDIEDTIKTNIKEHQIQYIAMDYIHTSMKILEEISTRSGGISLREDNILFMLSNKLKDICNEYGVFIESATQLNGQFRESENPDQTLLRGSKAIADKIDYGSILLPVGNEEIEKLKNIIVSNGFETPNLKLSVYKNRRGRWKSMYVWCKANLGVCRVEPLFATTWNYEPLEINNTTILVDEPGAF